MNIIGCSQHGSKRLHVGPASLIEKQLKKQDPQATFISSLVFSQQEMSSIIQDLKRVEKQLLGRHPVFFIMTCKLHELCLNSRQIHFAMFVW